MKAKCGRLVVLYLLTAGYTGWLVKLQTSPRKPLKAAVGSSIFTGRMHFLTNSFTAQKEQNNSISDWHCGATVTASDLQSRGCGFNLDCGTTS